MKKPNTVLISGATGFLGSQLALHLANSGYMVVLITRSNSNKYRLSSLQKNFVEYDVDICGMDTIFNNHNIDFVIHTACSYGRNNEKDDELIESNVLFGLKLLSYSEEHNVKAFFNTDTLLNSGVNRYSLSKSQFLEWFKNSKTNLKRINIRVDLIYGADDNQHSFLSMILEKLYKKSPRISLTKGEQIRNFIHVSDVVLAYMTLINSIDKLKNYDEFYLGADKPVSIKDFVYLVKNLFSKHVFNSNSELGFGDIEYRYGDNHCIEFNAKPLNDLGWQPKTSIEDGISKVILERYSN